MILIKKFKFFPQSILFQNCFDMRFDGGLGKKISLFRLQKCHFKIRKNLQFSKGLTHDFWNFCIFLGGNPYTPHFGQKLENSSNLFFIRKGLDMMFDGVLGKKDVFLD